MLHPVEAVPHPAKITAPIPPPTATIASASPAVRAVAAAAPARSEGREAVTLELRGREHRIPPRGVNRSLGLAQVEERGERAGLERTVSHDGIDDRELTEPSHSPHPTAAAEPAAWATATELRFERIVDHQSKAANQQQWSAHEHSLLEQMPE